MNKRINISIDPVALGQLEYIAELYGCNRSKAIEYCIKDVLHDLWYERGLIDVDRLKEFEKKYLLR